MRAKENYRKCRNLRCNECGTLFKPPIEEVMFLLRSEEMTEMPNGLLIESACWLHVKCESCGSKLAVALTEPFDYSWENEHLDCLSTDLKEKEQ